MDEFIRYVQLGNSTNLLCANDFRNKTICSLLFNYTTPTRPTSSSEPTAASNTSQLDFWDVFWALLATVICLITVCGNILVIVSFFLERSLRTPSNYFIFSLAVSDLLIGLISAPLYTTYLLMEHWPLGEIACDLWLSLDYTVCLTSQYTVFFITLDRFLSVKIPAKYRSFRTHSKVMVMVAVTWVLPTGIFFTVIIGWQFFVGERTVPEKECHAQFLENPIFLCILVIGYYWVTLIVMCVMYAGIYRVALGLQKRADEKRKKMSTLMSMAGASITRFGVGLAQPRASLPPPSNEVKQSTSDIDEDSTTGTPPVWVKKHNFGNEVIQELEESNSDEFGGVYMGPKAPGITKAPTSPTPNSLYPPPMQMLHKDSIDMSAISACATTDIRTHITLTTTTFSEGITLMTPLSTTDALSERGDRDLSDYYFLCISPDKIHGFRFADQESNRSSSVVSSEILYLSDLQRHSNKREGRSDGSPVWKRRFPSLTPVPEITPVVKMGSPPPSSHRIPRTTDNIRTHHQRNGPKRKSTRRRHKKPNRGSDKISSAPPADLRGKLVEQGRQLKSALKRFSIGAKSTKRSKGENRARKALRTITLILGIFVLCWTPYHILVVVMGFCSNCVSMTLYSISYWFCYLNSPFDPFCYALSNTVFKKTFLRILKGDFRKR